MKKIAITGTIASGKSIVVNELKRLGYPVFDADEAAKQSYAISQPSFLKMIDLFQENVQKENGEIDRNKVASLIFSNKMLRQKLNQIIHPYVLNQLHLFFEIHRLSRYVFAEIPLLYEVGWENEFDIVIVVSCDTEIAIQRMIHNRGYQREDAKLRIASQLSSEYKIGKSDFVIYNNSSKEECFRQLDDILVKLGGEE